MLNMFFELLNGAQGLQDPKESVWVKGYTHSN